MTHQHRELYTLYIDTRYVSTTRLNKVDNIRVNLNTSGNLFLRFQGRYTVHRFIFHYSNLNCKIFVACRGITMHLKLTTYAAL